MSIVLKTPSNGSVTLAEQDTASNVTVTIPAGNGTLQFNTIPQITLYSSGSGTYSVPSGCRYLIVEMVGGGGGGAGSGSGQGAGSAGGTTSFGTSLLTCAGGGGAANYTGGSIPSATLNSPAVGIAISGARGSPGTFSLTNAQGATGGVSPFGGAGAGGDAGASAGFAATGFGSGGGGGGYSSSGSSGAGGSAGAYIKSTIYSPSASYAYAVGAGGGGGAAGSTGAVGGVGCAGVIIITAYF
jgi:hypothetical protein